MKINKTQISAWLAGTADAETVKVVEADLLDREHSEALVWLTRLVATADKLDQLANSDEFDRWLAEDDADAPSTMPGDVSKEPPLPRGELLEMLAGVRGSPATPISQGAGRWALPLPDDDTGRALSQAIGEHCYGNPIPFIAMTLHIRAADQDNASVQAEIEIAPPPLLGPLTIVVVFATGDRRAFTIDVPVSPRRSTRSAPCEALSQEAGIILGGQWLDSIWPPTIVLS